MPITDRYLENPAALPAPGDGLPWGTEELWIDFVGGPYHVTGVNAAQRRRLEAHFAEACIGTPGAPTVAVEITVQKPGALRFRPPAPPPRELSFDLQAEPDHMRVAGESLCGRIACLPDVSGELWTDTDGAFFTRNVFENFFRIVVTYRLLEHGGLLVHSAAVVSRGQAYLFPGRSGDGKSTVSRRSLAEGREVLSDDMNAVTWRDGAAWVEKVPFTGDLGRTWSRGSAYPLRAILALEKSAATRLRGLPPAQAMGRLTACAPYLNADTYRSAKLLENLQQLTGKVPAHILAFSLQGEIWPVIEGALQP